MKKKEMDSDRQKQQILQTYGESADTNVKSMCTVYGKRRVILTVIVVKG